MIKESYMKQKQWRNVVASYQDFNVIVTEVQPLKFG